MSKYKVGDIVKCCAGIGKVIETDRPGRVTGLNYLLQMLDGKNFHEGIASENNYQNDEYWWATPYEKIESKEFQIVCGDGKIMASKYDDGKLTDRAVFHSVSEFKEWGLENLPLKEEFPKYVEIMSNDHIPVHGFEIGQVAKVLDIVEHEDDVPSYFCRVGELEQYVDQRDVKPVKLVGRDAKPGEYIIVTDPIYSFCKKGDIARVDGVDGFTPYVYGRNYPGGTSNDELNWSFPARYCDVIEGYESIEEELKPYLYDSWCNRHIGIIGDPTSLHDIKGNDLYVGDVVTLIIKRSSGRIENLGFRYVCKDDEAFVMGVKGSDFKSGYDNIGFLIIKEKSYEDLDDEEMYDHVKVVLKDD